MRVKVGDTWYEATKEQPIMAEFDSRDRELIAGMPPEYRKYAVFADGCTLSVAQREEWMEKDNENPMLYVPLSAH